MWAKSLLILRKTRDEEIISACLSQSAGRSVRGDTPRPRGRVRARNLSDVVRLQTEYVSAQMQNLNEQTRNLLMPLLRQCEERPASRSKRGHKTENSFERSAFLIAIDSYPRLMLDSGDETGVAFGSQLWRLQRFSCRCAIRSR